MIRGIGVDIARISEIADYMAGSCPSFLTRTFSPAEIQAAGQRPVPAEYYAARFAAKEAVFKAVAHLLPVHTFDLRIIETLSYADGSPYIHINDELSVVLKQADVDTLHISLTTEGDYATAFVVACGD